MIIPFSWVFVDDNLKYNVHEAETRKVHLDEQKKSWKNNLHVSWALVNPINLKFEVKFRNT